MMHSWNCCVCNREFTTRRKPYTVSRFDDFSMAVDEGSCLCEECKTKWDLACAGMPCPRWLCSDCEQQKQADPQAFEANQNITRIDVTTFTSKQRDYLFLCSHAKQAHRDNICNAYHDLKLGAVVKALNP